MFDHILSKLHAYEVAYRDEVIETRRRFLRHESTNAEVMVGGVPTALRDWSLGGVLFDTPRVDHSMDVVYYEQNHMPSLAVGDEVRVALRFHVLGETIEIPVAARVLRMGSGRTVARFTGLDAEARRKFGRVVDLQNTRSFLESQDDGTHNKMNRAA